MTSPRPNGSLRPGKGAHFELTEETLDFLYNCFVDLWNAAGATGDEETEDPSLNALIDSGNGIQFLKDINGSATHWVKAKDNFGTKLYKEMPWQDGTMRVTVVLNSKGALKIDVRSWYDPTESVGF